MINLRMKTSQLHFTLYINVQEFIKKTFPSIFLKHNSHVPFLSISSALVSSRMKPKLLIGHELLTLFSYGSSKGDCYKVSF